MFLGFFHFSTKTAELDQRQGEKVRHQVCWLGSRWGCLVCLLVCLFGWFWFLTWPKLEQLRKRLHKIGVPSSSLLLPRSALSILTSHSSLIIFLPVWTQIAYSLESCPRNRHFSSGLETFSDCSLQHPYGIVYVSSCTLFKVVTQIPAKVPNTDKEPNACYSKLRPSD